MMIKELDLVVLTHDINEYELKRGDVITVVHCYSDGEGFEVEFVTADGETIGVLTLTRVDIRPRARKEILRVSEIEALPPDLSQTGQMMTESTPAVKGLQYILDESGERVAAVISLEELGDLGKISSMFWFPNHGKMNPLWTGKR